MRDVVVVGGGPAGLVCAAELAARGHDVVVLEEHETVGAPVHCTGLLGWDAFGEFDLPHQLILGHATSARFRGAAGESVSAAGERASATVVDRTALDRELAARAVRAGAEIRCGWRADQIDVGPTGVVATGRGGADRVDARVCVLACGASYRFHRQLGLGLPEMFLQSAQVETPFPGTAEVEVHFGRRVAPGGFAWLVPLRRDGAPFARIGLMSETRSADHFAAFARSLCARANVDLAGIPAPRQKMLPLAPVGKTYADRVVAVGDAAGLVKPTTGGGIYYGMISGRAAAEVLDTALSRDRLEAGTLRRYQRAWKRRLGQEIRVGLAFRRIAARLGDPEIDAIIELARVNGIIPMLQEKASFNWHRKAAVALLADASFRRIVARSWRASPTGPGTGPGLEISADLVD